MNQSCNKLRYLFVIFVLLAAMILGIPGRASAYLLKTLEENTKHLNYIDVAVDSDGNLYTFDSNKHIVKMDPDGNILYDFGNLYDPRLLTVDPSGNVIVISTNENNNDVGDVVKFSKTATGYSFAWQKTMCVDVYPGLKELTTDSSGNFYLVFDNSVDKYDPSFNYITYFSSTYSNGYINGVAVVDNVIYYTDGYNRKIMKIDATGAHTIVKALPFEGDLITLDGSGNIYVTETRESDCYIYKIDAGGNLSFYAAVMEKYNLGIIGLAADRNGNVYAGYLINYDNSAVVRVIPSPEVSGISISSGPANGGTPVTITGTGFSGATEVRFGTNAAPSFSVVNDTTITVTSPPGSGVVSITVTTPARGASNPSSAQFYYIPVVSGISPTSGPATGGTSVDITGTGFTGVTGVKFGGNAASFTFVSDTKITATAPAGSGVADVTVTTAGGTSQTGPGDRFNYIPVVSGISPASGPIVGGATVTISGKGLTGATEVKFGSAAATILSVTDTSITVTIPPGSGVVDVSVTTPGGTSVTSTASRFSYLPVVNSISPNYGPLEGGTQVTISGSGFTGASAVNFGAKPAVSFTINSDTQITATAPAGSGWVDVTVTTAGCTSSTGAGDRFYYPPAVSGLSLHEGTAQGYTSITITGTGFINVTGVSFGSITAKNYTVNSDTKITATAPKWGGMVHVYVTTVGGTSQATNNDLFTFIPAVSSVAQYEGGQGTGPATGGTKVAISGYGIGVIRDDASGQKITVTPTAVYFGATPATNVAVDTLYAGFINVNAPPGCGVVDVTVVTAYGTTTTTANAKFKYIPVVNSITATGGPAAGGTEVTINGAGFTSDSMVKFGTIAATNVTYISDKQIKAISPPGNGKVDIAVTTPGGTSAAGIQFTYGPVVNGVSPSIGPQAGGTSVAITGSGFTGATAVKFGSANSAGFTVNSDISITATAPAGSGMVHVIVTTPAGTSPANSKDQYYYAPIPTVTGLSPAFGPEAGGKTLTISGLGFTGTTAVQFGDKPALNFTVDNDTRLTVTSPAGTGAVDVIITTPGGTSVANPNAKFAYNELAPPHFDLASSGPYNTAQRVAITCDTAGASIRYTTDGNDPDGSSALYDGTPVLITRTATLKARVFMTGWEPSAVAGKEYQINSTITKYQPRNDDPQTSPNLVFTAQNFRNDPSVQFNSASLWLGRGNSGSYSDLWLYFPHLIGGGTAQIPADTNIVSAKLVLTLKETNGNQNQPRGFKLYQITDPDGKGKPYFGASGLFNGLDFKYRDHRPGRNIKWADAVGDITGLFETIQPVDTYELIPSVFQNEGYNEVKLDVTASIVGWLSGDSKKANQGWYLTVDQALNWGYNDSLVFYGVAEEVASRRPRLEVTYIAQNVDNTPPGPVTDLSATIINQSVELKWTKPNGAAGVVLVCKAGVIPADPTDGAIVYDGPAQIYLDNKGLSSGKTYYYAVFAYDDLRNYSSEDYEKVILVTGGPSSPSNLTVSLSDNKLTFNWNDNSDNEDWFVIEQQKSGDSTWRLVAYPGASQTGLVVKCDDPNFNLEPNRTYQYRIKAVNAFGSSVYAVNAGNITTPGFPAAPANLAWTIISAGRVNLSWTDKASNETAYRVDVCRNDAGHTVIRSVSLSADADSVSITGLKPGVQYLFKVSAVNGDGEGAVWSDIIVTTKDPKGGLL